MQSDMEVTPTEAGGASGPAASTRSAAAIASRSAASACVTALEEHLQPASKAEAAGGSSSVAAAVTLPLEVVAKIEKGDVAAVKAWLGSGGQVDAGWDAPDGSVRGAAMLMHASGCGHEKMVELLLDGAGAAP